MKVIALIYLFFWSLAAFAQGDQPSNDAFKQHLFEALEKKSSRALNEISANDGVVPSGFFEQVENIDLSQTLEFCSQWFSAKSKESGSQEFIVEAAFFKRDINNRSHIWILAGLRKLQNRASRNGEVMIPRLNPNSDFVKNQQGFLPLAHEFNFSDFSRAVEDRTPEVMEYLRNIDFDFLVDYRLEPFRGTTYIISGVIFQYSGGQNVNYNFIAQDLPVSDQNRKSGWYLKRILPADNTQLTTGPFAEKSGKADTSQEKREKVTASESVDGQNTPIEVVAYYHDDDYEEFPYRRPFLRVVIRGASNIEYNFDRRTEEIVIRCKNFGLPSESFNIKKEQKKYFSIRTESDDDSAIFIIVPSFRVGGIKGVFRSVDKKRGTRSCYIDILPLEATGGF